MIPQSFKGSIQKVFLEYLRPSFQASIWNPLGACFPYTWHNHAYPHPHTPMNWLPDYLATIRTKSRAPWVPKNVSQMTQLEWWVRSHYYLPLSVIFSTTMKHFQGTDISHQTGSSEKHRLVTSNMTWKGGKLMLVSGKKQWLQFISGVFQPGSRPHLAGGWSSGCGKPPHPPSTLMPALSKRMPSLGPGGQKESKQFAAHVEV